MKNNPAFSLRRIGDVYLLVSLSSGTYHRENVFSTNEIGALLWNTLNKDCTEDTLLDIILNKYHIDRETAWKDLRSFLTSLERIGALER